MKKTVPVASARWLSAHTKSELIASIESLPCAPGNSHEPWACPAERLKLELGAHRVELETQNLELRESQQRIEEARDRYADLYDFAPVGYVTLDRQGCVQEINLTGAAMLGCERKRVLGRPLILWLQVDCHEAFYQHLHRVCASSERVLDEMRLRSENGPPRHISMISSTITHGLKAWHACRTALVDITPLKEKETELTQSRQQLRDLSAHLDRVREEERRHLAREIHDELGQKLTALRFEVAMLNTGVDTPAAGLTTGLTMGLTTSAASLLRQIDDTIESVRAIATNLRPAVLDLGLAAAIEWQVQQFRQRTGIACDLRIGNEEIPLDNDRATAVFRIVQESLTNIVRHAGASLIQVNVDKRDDCLHIRVTDNGVGMAADALEKSRSFGIAGMRERVLLLNGEMKISSHPGAGAELKITIPLKERRQPASGRAGVGEID